MMAIAAIFMANPVAATTVTSSNLLDQREGYARNTTGGLNGTLYVVTSKADYASNATPVPGTLRYGIEQLAGRRWIVFNKSLFTSTLSDGRRGAFFNFDRQLHITQGNITIDGRAGSVNGAGRVVVLRRSYNWNDYTVTGTGTGSECVAKPGVPSGHIMLIQGARNIIVSHVIFRQHRIGSPSRSVHDESCFGDQISISNTYGNNNPIGLAPQESYGRIWINRSQFYQCGDECIGITQPSPSLIALISITRNEFYYANKSMLVGNVGTAFTNRAQWGLNYRIRLTVAKNHFVNGQRRMPLINSSILHSYNNYFQNWTAFAINADANTRVFAEQNFFSTYRNDNSIYRGIDKAPATSRIIWAENNTYYKNAISQDYRYPAIERNPPRGYYDSAATPDIINIRAMYPVSAYTMLADLGGWLAENNDLY